MITVCNTDMVVLWEETSHNSMLLLTFAVLTSHPQTQWLKIFIISPLCGFFGIKLNLLGGVSLDIGLSHSPNSHLGDDLSGVN